MTDTYQESNDSSGFLRPSVAQVMDIQDVTMGRNEAYTVRFRGRLKMDSQEAYAKLEPEFHQRNFTPLFRLEDDQHVILAVAGVVKPRQTNPWINYALFGLTLLSMFFAGATYQLGATATDFGQLMIDSITHLYVGWPFAVSMFSILVAHEFGHYFAARLHKSPTTLPYFIPMPLSPFGTMGAVIAITAPVRNRRVLHDIGVAGPLAGLVVAIGVLFIGLLQSPLTTIAVPEGTAASMEGQSILYLLLKFIVFGKLLPLPVDFGFGGPVIYWIRYFLTTTPFPNGAQDVLLGQVAWAGWAGLLITGLNLIPAGQLDGGHTLFVLIGKRVQKIIPVILVVLAALGLFWTGWWLWAAIIYFVNRRPAELLDEITPLDSRRRVIAVTVLIIFFLVVTPIPLSGSGVFG
jgi:membrane-associated protease RseP (regulator of RpoE activity)